MKSTVDLIDQAGGQTNSHRREGLEDLDATDARGKTVQAASDESLDRITEQLGQLDELDRDAATTTPESHDRSGKAARSPSEPLAGNDRPYVSVVIAVYNEESTIEEVIRRIQAIDLDLEIVVVDDCSTDGTRSLLTRFEQEPDIHVIYKPVNQGKGSALRTGFKQAVGQVVVVQDADLEYHPNDIPALLQPLINDEADIVYGSRFLDKQKQDRSWIHRCGNRLLTWASNRTTGLKLTDMETCYKAFRRDALRGIKLEQDRFGFEPEVTAKLARRGHRFSEVPISYRARTYEEGKKIGVRDLFNALYCIWRYGHSD